jgi:hypothetical protein
MAPGATGGRVEPQNHSEQGHEIHPIFSGLLRECRPPHEPGIRVAQGQELRRGHQQANPRGLTGPIGRGPHCGPDAFGKILSHPEIFNFRM